MFRPRIHAQISLFLLLALGGGFLNSHAQEIRSLDGGGLKACSAAVERFSSLISSDAGKSGVEGFLALVEDYDVRITIEENSYTFIFVPKPYHGERIKGGGASVVVRKEDYKVIDVKYFK
jgi:hypothetical protein